MPSSPRVGSKMIPEASEVWFPPTGGKRLVTALGGVALIRAFPVEASFLIVGTMKELILIGSETLSIYSGAFFEEEDFSLLD